MNTLTRLGASAAAGLGAAIVAALIVTVVDLYLTGHGHDSITRGVIAWEQAGVDLSIGDVGMLVTAIAAAVSTWYFAGRGA